MRNHEAWYAGDAATSQRYANSAPQPTVTEYERIRQELEGWSQPPGVSPSTLLQLSEPLRSTLKQLMRSGSMGFAELADRLGLGADEAGVIAELLVSRGLLGSSADGPGGEDVYRLRRGRTHRPSAPAAIWDLLGDDDEGNQ